jgi:hypothetical protein
MYRMPVRWFTAPSGTAVVATVIITVQRWVEVITLHKNGCGIREISLTVITRNGQALAQSVLPEMSTPTKPGLLDPGVGGWKNGANAAIIMPARYGRNWQMATGSETTVRDEVARWRKGGAVLV